MSDSVNLITTYSTGATELNPFFMTLTAVGGSVNLLVVLMHWLSPNIRRPSAFVNFFASLVVWAASYGLLSVFVIFLLSISLILLELIGCSDFRMIPIHHLVSA